MLSGLSLLLALLFTGLATWMTVASVNNATDSETNVCLVGTMFSMRLLLEDPAIGNKLKWRAINPAWARPAHFLIVVAQALIALALWRAAILDWCDVAALRASLEAQQAGNFGLTAFIGLWLAFMAGGFWFAYWIKQGTIQQVHMGLLQIGILAAVLNNISLVRAG